MTLLSKAVLLFILSPTIIVGQLEGNPGSVKPKRPCWTTCPISVAHKTLLQKVHNIVYSQDVKGTTIGIDFGVTPTTTGHQKNYYRNLAALLTLTMPPSNPILNYYRYENGGGGACDSFNFCRRRVCEKGAIMIGSYDSLFSITSSSNFDGISALVQGKNMIDSATCPRFFELLFLYKYVFNVGVFYQSIATRTTKLCRLVFNFHPSFLSTIPIIINTKHQT